MSDVTALLLGARQALSAGEPGRALPLLKEAVAAEPGSCQARMLLGVSLWLSGSREQGIIVARRAVELDGQSAEAHYNLGVMLQMAGRLEDAAQHLDVAVSLKPDHQRAADALKSVRAALPVKPPSDAVPLLPSPAEAAQGERVDLAAQVQATAPTADEPVEAAAEQVQPDTSKPECELPESDWFDTLAAALQTIDPPEDAEGESQTEQGADGGPDPAGPTG